jgi:hypothetical protein
MAYSKIRDDSASDADHGKDEFLPWARRDEPRILFYRNLFAVALALWIATLTTLVWTLLSRDEPFRSHVATSLLFPSGTSQRRTLLKSILKRLYSTLPGGNVRPGPPLPFHRL